MKTIYCDIKPGMTRNEFITKSSSNQMPDFIEVCFNTKEEMEEFDAECMCFPVEKHHDVHGPEGSNSWIKYESNDFEELERNISYMVNNLGWKTGGLLV